MLRLHLDRLSDIAISKEDRSFGESLDRETELKGDIELRDVFYRYAPSDPPVPEVVNLSVKKRQVCSHYRAIWRREFYAR